MSKFDERHVSGGEPLGAADLGLDRIKEPSLPLWETDDDGQSHPTPLLETAVRWTQGDYVEAEEVIKALIPLLGRRLMSAEPIQAARIASLDSGNPDGDSVRALKALRAAFDFAFYPKQ